MAAKANVQRLLARLSSPAMMGQAWKFSIMGELNELRRSLLTILHVLDDAMQQLAVRLELEDWLQKIEVATCEAESVMVKYFDLKQQQRRRGSIRLNPISFFFTSRPELRKIVKRLDAIARERTLYDLRERFVVPADDDSGDEWCSSCPQGRDFDHIRDIILTGHSGLQVFPIYAEGGMGKTAIARLIYEDSQVRDHFDIRAWVCVSEQFDFYQILREMCRGAPMDSGLDLPVEWFAGRRLLLVLDDAWYVEDENWKRLRYLLSAIARHLEGVTVLVTTRSEQVATMMGTSPPYLLQEFNRAACPLLDKASERRKVLHGIGLELCDLMSICTFYARLPSYLKRCLKYCSLFPRDYAFDRDDLIDLWVAEGFIAHPSYGREEAQDIARGYFAEMVSLSICQVVNKCSYRRKVRYEMNPRVHLLVGYVTEEEYLNLDLPSPKNLQPELLVKCHHISVVSVRPLLSLQGLVNEQNKIRTLLVFEKSTTKAIVQNLLDKMQHLYVLDLQYSEADEVDGVEALLNLRYLNLSSSRIEILPESIGNLQNLRVLKLSRCQLLQVLPASICHLLSLEKLELESCYRLRQLPDDMSKMISLRQLNVNDCPLLASMPPAMSQLYNLLQLTRFVVSERIGSTIKELQRLVNLRELHIDNLQTLTISEDARAVELKKKKHLQTLVLQWNLLGWFSPM